MPKILVVEDKEAHRRLIMDILAGEGYLVEGAENGMIALEKMAHEHYDLVTLDQQMPKLSGLDCYEQMDPQIPVVFITVFGSEKVIASKKSNRTQVVIKPLIPDDIIAAVRKLINP